MQMEKSDSILSMSIQSTPSHSNHPFPFHSRSPGKDLEIERIAHNKTLIHAISTDEADNTENQLPVKIFVTKYEISVNQYSTPSPVGYIQSGGFLCLMQTVG